MTEEYIDLGLPSGTVWKNTNEEGYYAFDEAVSKYSNYLPTKEQWEELKNLCQWEWIGDGYRVNGPNGNSITLPAEGIRFCNGVVYGGGSCGDYWSSTPDDSDCAWRLCFDSSCVFVYNGLQSNGRSVRLVK